MAREIFISYSRKDKNTVRLFVQHINDVLRRKDCCWIDLKDIESGEEFEDVIMRAIEQSQVVLFMLSDNSLKSPWTKREVYYAESEGKRIVPVLVDGDKLRGWFKFHFGNVHYIDIQSEEHITMLIENLKTWIGINESNRNVLTQEEQEIINLFPIEIDGKFGYADNSGKVVIPCQWLYAEGFSEGLARIHKWNSREDNHHGFIDKNGNLVIPCQWKLAKPFSEGLAAVMNDNDMWGFINKKGLMVIPCHWKGAQSFSDGLAVIKGTNRNCGFIDKMGMLVIPCQWREATSFKNGFAKVEDYDRKWWIIDKTGQIIGETTR
jgi:hypothetical protein